MVFWTSGELDRYLKEALRLWQVAAWFQRDRGTLTTTGGTQFYDLSSVTFNNSSGDPLYSYVVKDQDLVGDLQAHLLEPITGNSWTGTAQFTLADLTQALERRRNQFLYETGIHLTYGSFYVPSPPVGRVTLLDSILDIRRIAWTPVTGTALALWRTDEFSLTALNPTWATEQGPPDSYSIIASPPVSIQLSPQASVPGTLTVFSVSSGAALSPASGVVMGLPDDLCQYVKWGALADLLSMDTESGDPLRAKYCEQRFQEGVKLAQLGGPVVDIKSVGNSMPVYAVSDADSEDPTWVSRTQGAPTRCVLIGPNLLALDPTPDTAYTLTIDVLRKAPLPAADGSYIQVGREHLDVILDYAVHLAMFKCGGQEFLDTQDHYERFMRLASQNNDRLRAEAENFDVLKSRPRWPDFRYPRRRDEREYDSNFDAALAQGK